MQKKIYLLIAVTCCILMSATYTQAQEKLWGINNGSVFNMNGDGSEYQEAFSDVGVDAIGLKLGPDGLLYGLFGNGSRYAVYIFNRNIGSINVIHYLPNHFYPTDFIVESSSVFYVSGYNPDPGYPKTIQIVKAVNLSNQILYSGTSDYPSLSILDGGDGRLYFNIASSNGGQIESIKKDGTDVQVIHNFSDLNRKPLDGARPETKLTILTDGSLLGATSEGGPFGTGTLYKMDKDGSNFAVVYSFKASERIFNHYGESLTTASTSLVYGMYTNTSSKEINNFSLDADGSNFLNVYSPPGHPTGHSNLIEYAGYLYGIGTYSHEQLVEHGYDPGFDLLQYSLDPASPIAHTTSRDFQESTLVGSIAIVDGTIYGIFHFNDQFIGIGSISQIFPSIFDSEVGLQFEFENSLGIGSDVFDLIKGKDGFIYGMTSTGGAGFYGGSIFKLNSDGASRVIGVDYGEESLNAKIVDSEDGYIYGVGLALDGSKIYRVKKDGTDYKVKIVTANYLKSVRLIQTESGDILGTTEGRNNSASVGYMFQFKPDVSGLETKLNFSLERGKVPLGNIIQLDDGFIYGTTEQGGSKGGGVVFKVLPDGQGYTKLHEFDYHNDTDGEKSNGGVADGGDGFLYGVTPSGGINDQGVIYKLKPDGSDFSVIHKFNGSVVSKPFGEMIVASDGFLYGSAQKGSVTGAIFKIKKDGTGLSKILEGNSPRLYFTDAGLEQPDFYVVNPSNGATDIPLNVTMQAKEVIHATTYFLELSKDQNFANVDHNLSSANSSFNVTGLEQSTTYYARVKTSSWPGYGPTTSFTTQSAPATYPPKLWGIQDNTVVYMNLDGSQYEKSFQEDINNQVPFPIGGFPYSITLINNEIFGVNKFNNQAQEGITLYKMNGEGFQGIIVESSQFNTVNIADGGSGFIYGVNICSPSCSLPYIFKFDYNGSEYMQQNINIYGFTPTGGIVTTTDNKMIGLSGGGGANNRGFMYSIRPDLSGIDILYSFSGPDGKAATTKLLEGHDGSLYGITTTGGLYNFGAVFSIQSNGQNYIKLYDFTSNRKVGTNPVGNLVQDSNDVLYGIGQLSGIHKKGMVFKINPDGSGFSIIYSFDGVLAENPSGNLLIEGEYIYGSASGKFFRVKTNGTDFTIIHEGVNTTNTLSFITTEPIEQDTHIIDSPEVGSPGYSFFSIPITTKPYSVQYTLEVSKYADFHELEFTGSGGHPFYTVPYVELPVTNLEYSTQYYARARSSHLPYYGPVHSFTTLPNTIRLFGLARAGGPTSCGEGTLAGGAVFSLELDGSNFIKHRDFPCYEGILQGSLVMGNDQALYGLNTAITEPWTELFRIDPSGNYSIVSNSNTGYGQFMSASNNSFYATGGYESFFLQKITPNPPMIVEPPPIASFDNSQFSYIGAPIEREDRYLYGLTSYGGTSQGGIMYKINLEGEDFQVLYNFNPATGASPSGKLVEDEDGHLYGRTSAGGTHGLGTIFRIEPDGSNYAAIHNFDSPQGNSARPHLLIINDLLYGVGAMDDAWVLFKIHTNGIGYSIIYEFDSEIYQLDGSITNIITDGLDYLYGAISGDGNFDLGSIFKIKKDGSEYSVIHEFTNYTGGWVLDGLLLVDPNDLQNTKAQPASRKPNVEFSSNEREKLVNISPNPFKSTFNVEVLNKTAPAVATIVDVSGRVLYERELTTDRINELGEDLATGFYVVRIVQGNTESIHRMMKK